MKIDFHLHTNASFDCNSDPEELLEWAKRKGLDCLAATDHDTMDCYTQLCGLSSNYGIQIIPAVEVTVRRGTHYLVYFVKSLPEAVDDLELIENVHRKGGLVALPHPFRSDTGLMYNLTVKQLYTNPEIEEILSQLDMIEIYNAKSLPKQNEQAQILSGAHPQLAIIGGSDSHHAATVGAVHTEIEIEGELTAEKVLASLKHKCAIVSLPELHTTSFEKAVSGSIEGARKLMLKIKPHLPEKVWDRGKSIYTSVNNRLTQKKALKSIDK